MTAIPVVLDALTAIWRSAPDLGGIQAHQVFDGPPVRYAGTEGVAVGASRDENAVVFSMPAAGLGATAERFSVTCLVWSGSGDTEFKPLRDRCDSILGALEVELGRDRTLGGAVSAAWMAGGSITQEQTGNGALVSVEFRIDVDKF